MVTVCAVSSDESEAPNARDAAVAAVTTSLRQAIKLGDKSVAQVLLEALARLAAL
jgi:hypothetical protein